jgi:hypothetical protein
MEKRELIKVMCQAVVIVKENDTVLREEISEARNCYSLEQIGEFYATVRAEVDQMNASNRKTRRSK